jgi:addiction module RelB/DinJ family antitoxin
MRVEKQLKRDAESILKSLGLNLSDGINIFLHRLVASRGIPFPVTQAEPAAALGRAAEVEAAAERAVSAELAHKKAAGLPIARFDLETGRAFLEYPDGRREYPLNA